ncbi:MAG: GIY-YIG nuclease family protein [Candidatus Doudnabacteria bacterium]|nr:GIY-YIG nuclease family protein [Candidatus Doudnabacteria bacterium]
MYFVYILQSQKDKDFYIGFTETIELRLKNHSDGVVASTKNRRPLILVYYEAYLNKAQALEREKKLKQFGSSYTGLLKRLGYK